MLKNGLPSLADASLAKTTARVVGVAVLLSVIGLGSRTASAQGESPEVPTAELSERLEQAERLAETALAAEESSETKNGSQATDPSDPPPINFLELMFKGGYLMLPIGLMSLLVVTFGTERLLGLRRGRVLPPRLIDGLDMMARGKEGIEPRWGLELCQRYPSAMASVVQAMLLKVGRPHAELETTVREASDREASRLYSNVGWLNLAAGITPLLGLLGTVWGMIEAFFQTANLPTGANKAINLADGIYKALVTTFAGLAVAIPAAVLAHYFESRIRGLFRDLDETLLELLPQLERFEGTERVNRWSAGRVDAESDGLDDNGNRPKPSVDPRSTTSNP